MNKMKKLRVLIIGGGIAGCTLSLALRNLNKIAKQTGSIFTSTCYEQAEKVENVGAGICLGPNGLRILASMGLYEQLQALGGEINSIHVYKESGSLVRNIDYSLFKQRYGFPMLALERAELQASLLHHVMNPETDTEAPPIVFKKRCVSVTDLGPGKGVRVVFEDGTSEVGDVILGADGVKSAVRNSLTGANVYSDGKPHRGAAKYSGISCILGVTRSVPEWEQKQGQGRANWVVGAGKIYGTWPMGKQKQYWFLCEQEEITADNLARWETTDGLKGMDRMWNWFHPYDAHSMFRQTERAVKIGLFQLPERQRWSAGNVAILGDAAHAMLPTVNQGANLAIEDACALARALAYGGASVPESLQTYDNFRRSRVEAILRLSNRTGRRQTSYNPIVHNSYVLSLQYTPQWMFRRSLDWIYSYKDEA